jgi:hypothetical protein
MTQLKYLILFYDIDSCFLGLIEVNWEYRNITLLHLASKYMSIFWSMKLFCVVWS